MKKFIFLLILIAGASAPANYPPQEPRGANGPCEHRK